MQKSQRTFYRGDRNAENLKLISDEGLKWYRSSPVAQRGFCENCGSTLFWKPIAVTESVFTSPLTGGLILSSHIFTGEKGDYYQIEGDEAQYEAGGADLSVKLGRLTAVSRDLDCHPAVEPRDDNDKIVTRFPFRV